MDDYYISYSFWHSMVSLFLIIPYVVCMFLGLLLKLFWVGAHPVKMKNPQTGQIKTGYWGYSWTYLLFGFWVPLIRGELGVAALHFLFTVVTCGLWQVIVSFIYNKQYTHRLIEKGFRLYDTTKTTNLAAARLGIEL